MKNRNRRPTYEPHIYVTLSCTGDRMDERDVKFENIEEDIQGRDLLTFTCPACGQIHKSYRLG